MLLYFALVGIVGGTGAMLVVPVLVRRAPRPFPAGFRLGVVLLTVGTLLAVWWVAVPDYPPQSLEANGRHCLWGPQGLLAAYPTLNLLGLILAFVAGLTAVCFLARLVVRGELSRMSAIACSAAFTGIILLGWYVITCGDTPEARMVVPIILPSPLEVVRAFPELHFHQELVRSAWVSFTRVTCGFTLAALVAVPLGVYMASFPRVAAFFQPLALAGTYVPIIVFIPLTLAWFGTQEIQKITFLFIACFVALLPLVIKTVADVASAYLDVAATRGASQWQLVWKVLFPVARADIWDHLRGVYGIGWGWIILAEVVSADRGLGYLINMAERRSHTDFIFAIVIVIVTIAVVCDQLWRVGGEILFPYRKRR